jgi:hypothetical protein
MDLLDQVIQESCLSKSSSHAYIPSQSFDGGLFPFPFKESWVVVYQHFDEVSDTNLCGIVDIVEDNLGSEQQALDWIENQEDLGWCY